jgi:ATP phosphoribosyltransferase regulatory subunit HisZ
MMIVDEEIRRGHNWVRAPEGVRDRLFAECTVRRKLESDMIALFTERGYREVATPALEYFNLFARTGHPLPEESLYKLTDREGRLLVLRPDLTLPIARLAATRLAGETLPLRLCAIQSVYRMRSSYTGRPGEWRQGGAELIGASGQETDVEIITLAIDCLCALGIDDFRLEIGHADPALIDLLKNTRFGNKILWAPEISGELDYYTGMVFRAYTSGAGRAVLQGGRYDNLLGCLGRDLPACGFSTDIDALIDVLTGN